MATQEMLTDVKELQSEASSCNNDNNTVALSDAIGQNEKLRLEMFRQFVKERRDGNQLKTRAEHAQLYSEARRLDILEKAPLVLTEILLTANIMEEISEHQSLLRYFCKQGHQFQKYFVYGLEQIICLHIDILLEKVPIILQLCFDSLGLFVSPILEWAENGSVEYIPKDISKKIRDSAQPFLHPHQQNERKQRFLYCSSELGRLEYTMTGLNEEMQVDFKKTLIDLLQKRLDETSTTQSPT